MYSTFLWHSCVTGNILFNACLFGDVLILIKPKKIKSNKIFLYSIMNLLMLCVWLLSELQFDKVTLLQTYSPR